MNPIVLVGCPTSDYHEYCLKEYSLAVKSLTYKNKHILLVDNSKDNNYYNKIKEHGLDVIKGPYFESARDRIVASRNILRQYCLDNNYDYLFSLEQDVIPPPNIIEQLLKYDKEIVSGVYCKLYPTTFGESLKPLIYEAITKERLLAMIQDPRYKEHELVQNSKLWGIEKTLEKSKRQLSLNEIENKGLIEVDITGLGCILIHNSVLKKIKFRYEHLGPDFQNKLDDDFDDNYFCRDAKKDNFKVFIDTSVRCKHLIIKRPWTWQELK